MAADAYILQPYDDSYNRVNDVVLNAIEYLTATETYLLNTLGKTEAKDIVHYYLTDTLRTVATAATAFGDDYTLLTRTTPSRLTNIIEKVTIPFAVTGAENLTQKYSGENELERQTSKALKEWAKKAALARRLATIGQKFRKLLENIISINYLRVKMLCEIQSASKLCFL